MSRSWLRSIGPFIIHSFGGHWRVHQLDTTSGSFLEEKSESTRQFIGMPSTWYNQRNENKIFRFRRDAGVCHSLATWFPSGWEGKAGDFSCLSPPCVVWPLNLPRRALSFVHGCQPLDSVSDCEMGPSTFPCLCRLFGRSNWAGTKKKKCLCLFEAADQVAIRGKWRALWDETSTKVGFTLNLITLLLVSEFLLFLYQSIALWMLYLWSFECISIRVSV